MTRPARLPLLALLALPPVALAQSPFVDLSAGSSSGAWRAAVSTQAPVLAAGPLAFQLGIRGTHFGGDAASYRSHDAAQASLPPRFRITPSVWSVNMMVGAAVRLAGPLTAGANLDVLGIAFGSTINVGGTPLRPAAWSLFRYGDRDRGSLNSEFFLGVRLGRRLAARGGVSHYVTGYQAKGGDTRPRYLRFDTVPFAALRWAP